MKTNPQTSRRLLLGGLALALVGALAFVALRTGPLAPVKVQVTPVTKGRVTPEIFGIGLVEAQRSWMVGPTTAGRVLGVRVDAGQTVQPGQVLAEMDPVDLDQRLAALDASLARAQSVQRAADAQLGDAQARRTLATPWRAISARITSIFDAGALSASISRAMRFSVSAIRMDPFGRRVGAMRAQ